MRSVLLASLRTHTRRYLAAVLAVTIGVSFIVVTAALSSAARDGHAGGVAAPYEGADVVADGLTGEEAARLRRGRRRRRRRGRGARVDHPAGAAATASRSPTTSTSPRSRPTPGCAGRPSRTGRFPTGPGEAAVDVNAAKRRRRRGRRPAADRHRRGRRSSVDRHRPRRLTGHPRLRLDLRHLGRPGHLGRRACTSTAWPGPDPARSTSRPTPIRRSRRTRPCSHATSSSSRPQIEANQGVDVLAIDAAALRRDRAVRVGAGHRQHLLDPVRPAAARLRAAAVRRRHPPAGAALDPRGGARRSASARRWSALLVGTALGHGVVALVNDRWPEARLGDVDHLPRLVRRRPGRRDARSPWSRPGCRPGVRSGQPAGGAASRRRRRRPHRRGTAADRARRRRPGRRASPCSAAAVAVEETLVMVARRAPRRSPACWCSDRSLVPGADPGRRPAARPRAGAPAGWPPTTRCATRAVPRPPPRRCWWGSP